jgi:hypothetical protein
MEVRLTGRHLFDAAYSNKSYYRSNYKGWVRALQAAKHAQWKALDLFWGNGESIFRILCTGALIVIAGTVFLSWSNREFPWPKSFFAVAHSFWGIAHVPPIPSGQMICLTIARLLLFGLFMAVLVKRLARR